ncbi:hypothetical protein MLD38_019106 [Melastoma candidum]|uniref:Uncharacterized protein n=1 Tax=Melastoma candidum TaxID=119954 RepID=A0ACB9QXT6_9MYRT|nr:hypothetical protein MLD38_019106 [Melastoma candidum]
MASQGIIPFSIFLVLSLTRLPPCTSAPRPCPPDQADALLGFSNSFIVDGLVRYSSCDTTASAGSRPKTASWNRTVDCCLWDGVTCDDATGYVVELDLKCSWLLGTLRPGSSLFRLRHLQTLNLSSNDFLGSAIPPEISNLEELSRLDLSWGNFSGLVPTELSHLPKLRSLSLAFNYVLFKSSRLRLDNPTLEGIARNLTELTELLLDFVDMSTARASSFMYLSSDIARLTASSCNLEGEFPESIFHLPNLKHLDFSFNEGLTGAFPSSHWANPLEFLDLSNTGFGGKLPDSIGTLENLTDLHLINCSFTRAVPKSLGNLTRMKSLKLLDNQFSGKLDFILFSRMVDLEILMLSQEIYQSPESGVISFPKLEELILSSANLTSFPYFMRSLDRLTKLVIDGNMIKDGIPSWFWNVSRDTLQILDLSNNGIEGSIQFPWPNLGSIRINGNQFRGSAPVPPPQTWYFDASYNNFTMTIPHPFCGLTSLWYLDLSHNDISGTIPSCLGNSTSLANINLGHNNINGEIPRSLSNCTFLLWLDVSNNGLKDVFPSWLEKTRARALVLRANKLYGPITRSTDGIPFQYLFSLDISSNSFEGSWPTEYFRNSQTAYIDISSNSFNGTLPLPPLGIYYFMASDNRFIGNISSQICSASDLIALDLSNNSLTGTLPECLINLQASLSVLNIRMNDIGGVIPEIFGPGNIMRTLDLSQNRFEGSLPHSLENCKMLEVLDLSGNSIEGSFPNWLDTLPELKVLILRSNKFHGTVNSSGGLNPFSKLRILDLSNNDFSGFLPRDYIMNLKAMLNGKRETSYLEQMRMGQTYRDSVTVRMKGLDVELVRILLIFTSLDLSMNNFQGPIPVELGYLKSLKGLNLSSNGLTGNIPSSLGDLNNLEWLDLSVNKLDGTIPKQLLDLTSLSYLNLSENRLVGEIPSGRQFNTFTNSSFEGNPELCGFPLSKLCGERPTQSPDGGSSHEDGGDWRTWWWKAALIGYGPGLVLGISLGYIFLQTGKPSWLASFGYRIESKVMQTSTRIARSFRK